MDGQCAGQTEVLAKRSYASVPSAPQIPCRLSLDRKWVVAMNAVVCLDLTEVRLVQTCSSNRHIIEISDTSIGISVPQHTMKVHGGVQLQLHIF